MLIFFSPAVNRPECFGNDSRLIGGATDTEGVVQVCLDGTYTEVCGFLRGFLDASVVCRQLGRPGDGRFLLGFSYPPIIIAAYVLSSYMTLFLIYFRTVGIPVNNAREFGVSIGDRNGSVLLQCQGDEEILTECDLLRVSSCPLTRTNSEAAGVICTGQYS